MNKKNFIVSKTSYNVTIQMEILNINILCWYVNRKVICFDNETTAWSHVLIKKYDMMSVITIGSEIIGYVHLSDFFVPQKNDQHTRWENIPKRIVKHEHIHCRTNEFCDMMYTANE